MKPKPLSSSNQDLVPPEFRQLGRFVFGIRPPGEDYCETFVLEAPNGDFLWHVQEGYAWTFKRIGRERALEVAAQMRKDSPEWFVMAKRRERAPLALAS